MNRVIDLTGYLVMLWRDEWAVGASPPRDDPLDEYKQAIGSDTPSLHLLHPRCLLSLATAGHLSARTGYYVLPVLLQAVCLKRAIGEVLADGTRIGDDIPAVSVETIDVCYPARLQRRHDAIYHRLVRNLHAGASDSSDPNGASGRMQMDVLRDLCHLVLTPRLCAFVDTVGRADSLAPAVAQHIQRDDAGFKLFFNCSTTDPAVAPPETSIAAARYLVHDSPKLRALLKILRDEGVFMSGATGPRFIIFVRWPTVLWVVEMLLTALGLPHATIRATMTPDERTHAAAWFTSATPGCVVLLTTFSCGALGLNLHGQCSRVIVVEPAPNSNVLFQAIGRVHRLGQREPQRVWILFGQHTIDRYIEANNSRKLLPAHRRSAPDDDRECAARSWPACP